MNFHFNEEEQEILDMLHDYAVKEVAPRAHEIDEEEKFPMEARNGLAEMGIFVLPATGAPHFAERAAGSPDNPHSSFYPAPGVSLRR